MFSVLQKSVRLGLVLAIQALLVSGCATTPGQGFTIFPAGNYLLDTTECLRDTAPRDPALPRELDKGLLAEYRIQPGDVLLLETESLDSSVRFPGDQTVLPDGTIDLGRYGRRVVAAKTIEQIEQDVQELVRVGGDKETKVNVRLTTMRGAVYYVLGEANSPGAFPLTGRETVLDGILAAGGISSRASTCNIILSRPSDPHGCRVVLPICYRHITQMGDTSTNYQLRPGDRIYIATRTCYEQLAFWETHQSCKFCCACQSSCPDGEVHSSNAPIVSGLMMDDSAPSPEAAQPFPTPADWNGSTSARQRASGSGRIGRTQRLGSSPELE
ncbi:MAG TPA: polysaccharide biosynthesis/export family protein [Pirellulales bacterium]|jgi:protein involved in polysaccharide export with SLBB domain|nr:polysaccharide biosynthesis/export family protein [Pirellulales bacterium]